MNFDTNGAHHAIVKRCAGPVTPINLAGAQEGCEALAAQQPSVFFRKQYQP